MVSPARGRALHARQTQPAVSRRRKRRNKTPKPIAKSDSIVGSSTATGLIEYVNSSVVTETLKSPSELRKHHASASTHGPPMVDTPSRFGTPNNRGKKPPSGNRRPDDEMTSSYCSKPSPVSSNKTSKPKSGSVGLTASSCNVIAFAVPKKLNRAVASKVSVRRFISASPSNGPLDSAGSPDYAKSMPRGSSSRRNNQLLRTLHLASILCGAEVS